MCIVQSVYITNPRFFLLIQIFLLFFFSFLHRLQVVGLLDRGPPLLAHRLAQLLPLVRRGNVVEDAAVLVAGQVDGLLLQRHLGGEGLEVALGEELGLEGLLALGGEFSLFLGFCYKRKFILATDFFSLSSVFG